jgi:hypothetical protein
MLSSRIHLAVSTYVASIATVGALGCAAGPRRAPAALTPAERTAIANFFALDARTGRSLWDFQTGGQVRAGPMSFMLGGKQYIGIAARRNIYVFALP